VHAHPVHPWQYAYATWQVGSNYYGMGLGLIVPRFPGTAFLSLYAFYFLGYSYELEIFTLRSRVLHVS